jgi:hypothetical protein
MPSPVTVQITITPYGPEVGDENPGIYLQRCGEALLALYGYDYSLQVHKGDDSTFRQLDIAVLDSTAAGGKRPVVVTAPDIVVDTNGSIEAMTAEMYATRYGGN